MKNNETLHKESRKKCDAARENSINGKCQMPLLRSIPQKYWSDKQRNLWKENFFIDRML